MLSRTGTVQKTDRLEEEESAAFYREAVVHTRLAQENFGLNPPWITRRKNAAGRQSRRPVVTSTRHTTVNTNSQTPSASHE